MSLRFRSVSATAFLLGFVVISGENIARAGLVSLYNFDETSGTTVHDSVGTNNGTLFGGATFDPGQGLQGSGALSLSQSTDSYATFGKIFPLTSGSATMVVWEKTTVAANFVLSEHHTGITAGYFIATGNVGDGSHANSHFFESSNSNFVGSNLNVTDGQWHQLAFVYTSGGTAQYYVDGSLQASGPASPILANDAPFMIGGVDVSGTLRGGFTGLIDQVSVYNNALSAANVALLYSNPLGTVPEPASITLMALGLAGAAALSRRRSQVVR